jgi:hypothetical protein
MEREMKTIEEILNPQLGPYQQINESPQSEKHEQDIADSFKGQTLPDKLPKWMSELGIVPGAKVVSSKKIGTGGAKPDVVVEFSVGESLRISAKMSNADYFGNWYTKGRTAQDLSPDLIQPLISATLNFATTYRPKMMQTYVGISISFGKRSGQTGKKFTDIFDASLIKYIIAGNNPLGKKNANCLYTTSTVPSNIEKVIENLQPVSDSVVKKLSQNFYVVFRPVFTPTNRTNMSKQTWVKLQAIKPLSNPTLFERQEDLLKVTEWVPTREDEIITHNGVVNELKKNNIYLHVKGKNLPKFLEK